MPEAAPIRNLVIVLGDQLNADSAVFDQFDPAVDRVWMAEVPAESTYVPSHKARIAAFLSAMRHFQAGLTSQGISVVYRALEQHAHQTLGDVLGEDLMRLRPSAMVMAPAGEFRVAQEIQMIARRYSLPLIERSDRHFLLDIQDFADWARGRKELRCEFLYRTLRRRTGALMTGDRPVGTQWNYDRENRGSFGRKGPPPVPGPASFIPPDAMTREVIGQIKRCFPGHPGSLAAFGWPVTPAAAHQLLAQFIEHRLPSFGKFQDAMWTGHPFLFHSQLSFALNVKLISPRQVIAAAIDAWNAGHAPLHSVEGFIRQVLGWREFVRGIYWTQMPHYLDLNALAAEQPLPSFYWNAQTDMKCLREVIGQTLEFGYAHHIQRLMVTGLFALLLGVAPYEVHRWYLAVYIDAVEWVEAPNTIGMSQYADGGIVASKPYVASGRYIERMSNYCDHCRFKPQQASGPLACPFTTLYWDFLQRHRLRFRDHPRTALQWRNLERLDPDSTRLIARQAQELRKALA